MLAKFLLIIYMGKNFSASDLGEYGLFTTTIGLALMVLGFDFYTFNTREIAAAANNEKLNLIKDQFVFHLLSYIIILPLLLFIFFFNFISYKYIIIFYLLLISEHLSQELFRIFTIISKPIIANMLLLLRMGLWTYLLLICWYFQIDKVKNLESIYLFWLVGVLISIVIGVYCLLKIYDIKDIKKSINYLWILKGFKVSSAFFICTVAYKIIEVSNRYFIDYFMDKASVGIYTFYASIANTMQTLVFTLVIMMYYPKMVEAYKRDKMFKFKKLTKFFFIENCIYSIVCILGVAVFIYPVIYYIDKPEFYNNLDVLWILLAGTLLLNLSFVPHYILFVKHQDKLIRNITIMGAILNIVLNLILIPNFGLIGSSVATLISFGGIYLMKEVKVK